MIMEKEDEMMIKTTQRNMHRNHDGQSRSKIQLKCRLSSLLSFDLHSIDVRMLNQHIEISCSPNYFLNTNRGDHDDDGKHKF